MPARKRGSAPASSLPKNPRLNLTQLNAKVESIHLGTSAALGEMRATQNLDRKIVDRVDSILNRLEAKFAQDDAELASLVPQHFQGGGTSPQNQKAHQSTNQSMPAPPAETPRFRILTNEHSSLYQELVLFQEQISKIRAEINKTDPRDPSFMGLQGQLLSVHATFSSLADKISLITAL